MKTLKSVDEITAEIAAACSDGCNLAKLREAVIYARDAYDSVKKTRKYTGDPYWVHTESVALICAKLGGAFKQILACLFHDILEDVTPENPEFDVESIEEYFGLPVACITVDLTDIYTSEAYPAMNRKSRKLREATRLGLVPASSKECKCCDLIDNTSDIVKNDPKFAITYIKEKIEVVKNLIYGNFFDASQMRSTLKMRPAFQDAVLNSLFAATDALNIPLPECLAKLRK